MAFVFGSEERVDLFEAVRETPPKVRLLHHQGDFRDGRDPISPAHYARRIVGSHALSSQLENIQDVHWMGDELIIHKGIRVPVLTIGRTSHGEPVAILSPLAQDPDHSPYGIRRTDQYAYSPLQVHRHSSRDGTDSYRLTMDRGQGAIRITPDGTRYDSLDNGQPLRTTMEITTLGPATDQVHPIVDRQIRVETVAIGEGAIQQLLDLPTYGAIRAAQALRADPNLGLTL